MVEPYISLSDEQIINLISEQNDEAAFKELYNRHFQDLFNYIFGKVNDLFVAQEITQELFVNVWTQRHNRSIRVPRVYLFSSAKNLIISYYRRELIRQRHYSQWGQQACSSSVETDHQLLTEDLENQYQEGLSQLSPKCREVFLLNREGESNQKIAEKLHISEKTVEQHITKARRELKEFIKFQLLPTLFLFIFF